MDSGISRIRSLAAILLSEINSIGAEDKEPDEGDAFVLSDSVRNFEIKMIKTALLKTGGNQRRAASLLGVKATTLNNKIKSYGIDYLKFSR